MTAATATVSYTVTADPRMHDVAVVVTTAPDAHYRVALAEGHRLAAEIEGASIEGDEAWCVEVGAHTDHISVVSVECDGRAERARAEAVVRRVVAAITEPASGEGHAAP